MTVSAQRIDFLPRRESGKHVHLDRGNYQSKNILMPRSIPLDGVRSTQMPGKLAGHQKNVSLQDTKRKKYGGIWRKHLFFPPGNLLINGNATTRFGNSQGISVKALGLLGLCGLDSRLRKNGMGGREWPGENHGLVSPFHRPNDWDTKYPMSAATGRRLAAHPDGARPGHGAVILHYARVIPRIAPRRIGVLDQNLGEYAVALL